MLLMMGGFYFWEHRVHVLTIYGSSLINNWNVRRLFDLGASGVGSKVWVLTIAVLEVNPELDSIRAQRGRARSALFSRVTLNLWVHETYHWIVWNKKNQRSFMLKHFYSNSTKKRASRASALRADGVSFRVDFYVVPQWSEPTPWTRPWRPLRPAASLPSDY